MLGPDPLGVDRFIRLVGVPRATDAHIKAIAPEEEVLLENYAAGVNKVVESMVVYPPEFQITFNSFEPW